MPEKTLREALVDVADAIRAKTESQETMTIEEMPGEIASIETGIIPTGTKNIVTNGDGIDVYNYASVNVNVPSVQPSGTIEIDDTGDYDVTNYATARVEIDCSQQISNEDSAYYDYQVAKGWTKASAAIRDFAAWEKNSYFSGGGLVVEPEIKITTSQPWPGMPGLMDVLDGCYYNNGSNKKILIGGICDSNYSNSTNWTINVDVTFTEYSESYDESQVEYQLQGELEECYVYDIAGRIVGRIGSVDIRVSFSGGC